MLTELQESVAQMLAQLPDADGFALAGGAALIARGDVERLTRDLDFFARLAAPSIGWSPPPATRGMRVEMSQVSATFARLVVFRGDDAVPVDLGIDAWIRPVETSPLGPGLAGEELAADKLLALFGRAVPRDCLAVMALERRYGLERMCDLAREKDLGFGRDALVSMIGRLPGCRRRNSIPILPPTRGWSRRFSDGPSS